MGNPVKSYHQHLKQDKKLSPILGNEIRELTLRKNIHVRLMASIMSQQLSTRVAEVIYGRFLDLYGGKDPKPDLVLQTPTEQLRSIGLSGAKVEYVRNVASFFMERKLNDRKLHQMDNESLKALLTEIKGVGKWTVEMLLMFSMGREDVFAPDDLGIQQAMIRLYKLDATNKIATTLMADENIVKAVGICELIPAQ